MVSNHRISFFFLALVCVLAGVTTAAAKVDFGKEIRPILSDRCYFCHGPDGANRKSKLRLDTEEGARKALGGGMFAIAPGDLEHSEVFQRISSTDPDERMPPPESNLKITKEEVALIGKWIEEGAKYEKHWSFVSLKEVAVPEVDNDVWGKGEIDRFVLEKLKGEELSPGAEATSERLIRRVSFDLTGLPPTLEEIDAFLADKSPEAYEKMVDRYLAKPAYGERMTSEWLDVARYSDSYGYQVDRDRHVWPWRDWVIKAFNENLPYDKFMTWQLAGDLLPNPSDEQVLATTFNRLHPQKVEGGSVPEEFRVEYVADRNHTTGTAFLGLTVECSRCHDHKYDPITQKEYYQLFAFFNNIDEAGLYSYFTPSVPTPTLFMSGEDGKKKLVELEAKVTKLEGELSKLKWEGNPEPEERQVVGQIEHMTFDDFKSGKNKAVPGKVGGAVQLTGDDAIGLKHGNFARWQPFSISLWMNTPDIKERAVVFHRSRAWTDAGSRGYELLIEDGKLSAALIHFYPGNAIRVKTVDVLKPEEWAHVTVTYDGSSRASGLRIFLNGQLAKTEVVKDHLTKQIRGGGGDKIAIGERFRDRGFTNGKVDDFRVFDRALTQVEVAHLVDGESLKKAEEPMLKNYLLTAHDAGYKAKFGELTAAREALAKANDAVTEIMVMRELDERRPSYILERGAYDARGEEVQPGVPAWLNPMPAGAKGDRLGLAKWLSDPQHPLAARVAVNRYWQLMFGEGLVRTPEDFGSQGALPTHPELLDWLAKDFIDHGWDVKRLLKQMVMSATYRQTSEASEELVTRDPENMLLARAPVYRLSAEMLRDQALAASGLLAEKVGGAPVRPYEVAVSFKPVKRDKGDGLYRRSLYTYWKRTGPAPVMMALDASKRDVCSVKRERTASPLQALVLLNDPQMVEASRVLGEKLHVKHGEAAPALVSEAFRILVGRNPSAKESTILVALYTEQLAVFSADPAKAEEYLKTGDAPRDANLSAAKVAAAAVVVNGLLNFDGCVMKR